MSQQARGSRTRDRAGGGGATMMLLIDNYDSFTYNLAHMFGALGVDVQVFRNDEIDADEAARMAPKQLVISPGPGRPGAARARPARRPAFGRAALRPPARRVASA